MFKAQLSGMAAKIAAGAVFALALAGGMGATASSADAATCLAGSGTLDGIYYCYTGRTSDSTGNFVSDNYATYVWNNGVSGSLVRVQRWDGRRWGLYGCFRTNPGFSGWTICPF